MKLVLIEWVDSHSTPGWKDLSDWERDTVLLHCRSVGWLVRRTKTSTMLIANLSGEKNGDCVVKGDGNMCIPNSAIRAVRVLEERRKQCRKPKARRKSLRRSR